MDNTAIHSARSYYSIRGTESHLVSTSIDAKLGQMGGPVYVFITDANGAKGINNIGIMSGDSSTGMVWQRLPAYNTSG